jgi:REP element-mobilizing transposase RayT
MKATKFKLWVHLVLVTEKITTCLKAEENIIFEQSVKIASLKYGLITEAVYFQQGHMHVLLQLPINRTLPEVVRWIKLTGTRWLKARGFAGSGFTWQPGFGAFSVSASQIDAVRKYIKTQPLLHLRRSFEEEYNIWLIRYDLSA